MKLSDVSKDDMKFFAQLINSLQVGEYTVNGKDACAFADSLRWFQKLAAAAAKVFSEKITSEETSEPTKAAEIPAAPETVAEKAPSGGLPDGVKIKAFHPGKAGKSK